MKNAAPWMVALIAFAAVLPVSWRQGAPKAAEQKSEDDEIAAIKKRLASILGDDRKEQAVEDPCHPAVIEPGDAPSHPAWCESLRVLRDFFGLEPIPHSSRYQSLLELVRAARFSNFRLRFMVALVSDPLDSPQPASFDTSLDAIQKGFAQAQFRFNRYWLPWIGEAAKKNRWYREEPGIVLFQRHREKEQGELAVVFLVGESPKAGLQIRAFEEALRLASTLFGQEEDREVDILGPFFSGSADSLSMALQKWQREERGFGPVRPLTFEIATGSATADGLENKLKAYTFCRTVVPDGPLRRRTLQFFAEGLGWELRKAALLAEGDTGYGQSIDEKELRNLLLIKFPSHIAEVRTAWHRDELDAKDTTQVKVGNALVPIGKPALKLNPDDQNEPVDVVPSFSSLTTPAKDLELSNVLQTISREGIRYVGILATDVNDKLFLADEIHRSSPDSILFTFESNLLFAHPEYGQVMDGTLVASSAPLYTEGTRWLPGSTPTDNVRRRQQFESESQEGTLAAVRFLLKDAVPPPRPRVWISAVGNGSLWPLRVLPVSEATASYCGRPPTGGTRKAEEGPSWSYESWLSGRAHLQVLVFSGILCLLSFILGRLGFLKGYPPGGSTLTCAPVDMRLILCGAALLAVSAGVILVLGSIPEWATFLWGESNLGSYLEWGRLLYLLLLVSIYLYLATKFFNLIPQTDLVAFTVWLLSVLLVPFLLIILIVALCMPGQEIAFFQLRLLTFGSGLSPLVSMTLLTAALFGWILCEVERHQLVKGLKTTGPQTLLCRGALAGCEEFLRSIQLWQERAFPPARWLWTLLASLFLPSAILLWYTIQPIAETKAYGRVFLLFFLAASVLALMSFLRYFVLWRQLLRVLRRLHELPPDWEETFVHLATEVDWQATRSFAFRLPRFKMLALAIDKLEALRADGWEAPDLTTVLKGFYVSEAKNLTLNELEARRELEARLEEAGERLTPFAEVPQVREFLALRIVAQLRYHFAHLRNSLMAATGMGILILVAVASFFFEPKRFVSLTIWGTLIVAVAMTFWSFLQMDRDRTLSRIAGTEPGEISFDKAFFANLTLYVLVPALSVVATQFPEVGRLLGRAADEFLRVAGGG